MKNYQHIFFDLDHTLWDYERNSSEVLIDLYTSYELGKLGIHVVSQFMNTFNRVNSYLWSQYNHSLIDRETIRLSRFRQILEEYGIKDDRLADELSEKYLFDCPQKGHLMPHSKEVLRHLKSGNYKLHILTNGFDDVQRIKIKASGLSPYFDEVITSDSTGAKKPTKEIFDHALSRTGAKLQESIMIGDNLQTDILGARNANMYQVFYNPSGKVHKASVTYEIHCLSTLKKLF